MALIDTGTSFLVFPEAIFPPLATAIGIPLVAVSGFTQAHAAALPCPSPTSHYPDLVIRISGHDFTIPPAAYLQSVSEPHLSREIPVQRCTWLTIKKYRMRSTRGGKWYCCKECFRWLWSTWVHAATQSLQENTRTPYCMLILCMCDVQAPGDAPGMCTLFIFVTNDFTNTIILGVPFVQTYPAIFSATLLNEQTLFLPPAALTPPVRLVSLVMRASYTVSKVPTVLLFPPRLRPTFHGFLTGPALPAWQSTVGLDRSLLSCPLASCQSRSHMSSTLQDSCHTVNI